MRLSVNYDFLQPSQATIIYLKLKYPQKSLTTMLSGADDSLHRVDRTANPHTIRTIDSNNKIRTKTIYNNVLYDNMDDFNVNYDDLIYRDPGVITTDDPVKGMPNEFDEMPKNIFTKNRPKGSNKNNFKPVAMDDSSPVFYDDSDKQMLFYDDIDNEEEVVYLRNQQNEKSKKNKKKKQKKKPVNNNPKPVTFLSNGSKGIKLSNFIKEIPKNHRVDYNDYYEEYAYPQAYPYVYK